VPGGGLAPDGESWIACRPGFFLPVRVLSSLFRRLFLEALDAAFRAGELSFHTSLVEPARFAQLFDAARGVTWVVYAKPPFGGPEKVSSISAATPTASLFPTAAWSGSRTAALPSAGRTTGIMTVRR
jgi:hypothetical protein